MAIDPETGIKVRRGGDFFDSTTEFPYTYTDGDLRLVFSVTPVARPITFETKLGPQVRYQDVALLIDRHHLDEQLSRALRKLGRPPLTEDQHKVILQRVSDGLFMFRAKGQIEKGRMVEFFSSDRELASIKARIEKDSRE
jgi:hypothetical protein